MRPGPMMPIADSPVLVAWQDSVTKERTLRFSSLGLSGVRESVGSQLSLDRMRSSVEWYLRQAESLSGASTKQWNPGESHVWSTGIT